MYKRHKILIIIVAVVVFAFSMLFQFHYSEISEVAITVISITLAVYITVATSLLGSSYSKSLKKMPDKEDPKKSMLGVLSCYLKQAGVFSVVTIIISSLYIIMPEFSIPEKLLTLYSITSSLVSAFSCTLFSLNIVYMSLIMSFLIVSLNNAAFLPAKSDE